MYEFSRRFLDPKILMETWIPSGIYEFISKMLWDHMGPSGLRIRSRGWNLSTKGVLDLIKGGRKGLKENFSLNLMQ